MDRRQFLRVASAPAGLTIAGCLDHPWTGGDGRSRTTTELTPVPLPETDTPTATPAARRYRPAEDHTVIEGRETVRVGSISFAPLGWTLSPTLRYYDAENDTVREARPPRRTREWFHVAVSVRNLGDGPIPPPALDTFHLFSKWQKHNPVLMPTNVPSWDALRETGTESPIPPPTTPDRTEPIPPDESGRVDLLFIVPDEDRLFLRWNVADSYDVGDGPIYVELASGP